MNKLVYLVPAITVFAGLGFAYVVGMIVDKAYPIPNGESHDPVKMPEEVNGEANGSSSAPGSRLVRDMWRESGSATNKEGFKTTDSEISMPGGGYPDWSDTIEPQLRLIKYKECPCPGEVRPIPPKPDRFPDPPKKNPYWFPPVIS